MNVESRTWDLRRLMEGPISQGGGWQFGPELDWQRHAACADGVPDGSEADLFFPGAGRPPVAKRALCARCPVREACLDYALAHDEQGMWGGLLEAERKQLLATHHLPYGKDPS